jgi:pimeloyl-ACP methyl ester carboxylesterase
MKNYAYNARSLLNRRITVIGHSLGGMMAAKIASDNPQVSAIVILQESEETTRISGMTIW